MPWGYSSNPNGAPGGGALPPGPSGTDTQRIARATEQIAGMTAPGVYEKFTALELASGGSAYIDTQDGVVSMLSVQVFSGTVDIVLGSQSNDPDIPLCRIGAIGVPVHYPLCTRARDITVFAVGGAAKCGVLLHSPS